jgi:DNA-binding transcriptional LysR family regulator
MDRLRALRTFIAVAERASFAEAARRLALSPTSVTRIIAKLEGLLGTSLLVRTTRKVRLTDEGAIFLDRCRAALAELDEAFETVRGGSRQPHGTLTVTAPVMFGRLYVVPMVTQMLKTSPKLQVRLLLMDRLARLVEEGIDVAVRIGELPDSELHMTRIGHVHRMLSASPRYLRERGEPSKIADLAHHTLIAIEDEAGTRNVWDTQKSRRSHASATRLFVNNVDAAIAAAVAGIGIVQTHSYQVADHLAHRRLKRVLVATPAPSIPVSILFRGGRREDPNIRAFIAAARQHVGKHELVTRLDN